MSIRTSTIRFLCLLGMLSAAPACSPAPVMLMDVMSLPPEAFRINVVVIQGSNVGKATFQRESQTNKWLPMESQTSPPDANCPPTTTVAVELPRGVDGAATIDVEIDGLPVATGMGMTAGAPTTMSSLANACLHVNLTDGTLNEIQVPLIATVADKPMCN